MSIAPGGPLAINLRQAPQRWTLSRAPVLMLTRLNSALELVRGVAFRLKKKRGSQTMPWISSDTDQSHLRCSGDIYEMLVTLANVSYVRLVSKRKLSAASLGLVEDPDRTLLDGLVEAALGALPKAIDPNNDLEPALFLHDGQAMSSVPVPGLSDANVKPLTLAFQIPAVIASFKTRAALLVFQGVNSSPVSTPRSAMERLAMAGLTASGHGITGVADLEAAAGNRVGFWSFKDWDQVGRIAESLKLGFELLADREPSSLSKRAQATDDWSALFNDVPTLH